ncbi:MAG: fibronectin type III domain-containing protein [Acidimicrobiales bacterium]
MLATLAALLGGQAGAVPGQPPDDPARGVLYGGLRQSAGSGACRGNYELRDLRDRAGRILCTHGPDPAPPGVDVRQPRSAAEIAAATPAPTPPSGTAAAGSVVCDTDGTSGYRVQLLYVHATDVADRSASLAASFQQWATNLDNAYSASAAETGGARHVRFVNDAACNAVVVDVTVSTTGDDDFNNTLNELRSQGFSRSDRKYLAWVDAYKYCGIAQVYYDDSASASNASNGNPSVPGELGRIDAGCWGQSASVEAHELMHTLGGVQTSAPHATPSNHCTDEYDRMCYVDGPGVSLTYPCPSSHEMLFDCNHDDYYNTSPASGSYLATHWNSANNRFLIGAGTTGTATATTTTAPATTTTTPPQTTTTTGPATTTTTRLPTTTTTTVPTGTGTVPSAPQNPLATQPSSGSGILVTWSPPSSSGSSAVTGYRIYRGTSPIALSLLATVGPATGYSDTATVRNALYYYQLTAVNAAGESPRSTYARMVAR